ncbi:MAG: zinc-ribbon domain-containing protein [Deltaproteobacteria bacterium]|nr:zinc-ribbon domain-containing protein [Deltaproteobacteria bacterium]
MEIICSGCDTKLSIPDDKIPMDQTVRINCPKCKSKITIKPQNNRIVASIKKNPSQEDQNDDDFFESYDDSKLALIMANEDINNKIRAAVEEKGYRFIISPTIRETLLKLRFNHFNLMILSEGFDGQEIAGGPIMNYLNHMAMSSRRDIFLVLIGDKFKTMDEMIAYALSANMVVNTKDLGSFAILLKRGLLEYQRFYKVFLDILEREGRS